MKAPKYAATLEVFWNIDNRRKGADVPNISQKMDAPTAKAPSIIGKRARQLSHGNSEPPHSSPMSKLVVPPMNRKAPIQSNSRKSRKLSFWGASSFTTSGVIKSAMPQIGKLR